MPRAPSRAGPRGRPRAGVAPEEQHHETDVAELGQHGEVAGHRAVDREERDRCQRGHAEEHGERGEGGGVAPVVALRGAALAADPGVVPREPRQGDAEQRADGELGQEQQRPVERGLLEVEQADPHLGRERHDRDDRGGDGGGQRERADVRRQPEQGREHEQPAERVGQHVPLPRAGRRVEREQHEPHGELLQDRHVARA